MSLSRGNQGGKSPEKASSKCHFRAQACVLQVSRYKIIKPPLLIIYIYPLPLFVFMATNVPNFIFQLSPGIWLISDNIAVTSGVVPLSMIC